MKEIIYTCNNILLSLNTEGHFDICYSMDEHEDIMICEISQSQKDSIVLFHLHELLRVVRFIERESRMVVVRHWEKGGTWSCFFFFLNEYRLSVLQDEKKKKSGD